MAKKCLIWTCPNKGNIPGISYHSLKKHRYDSWLRAIGRSPDENIWPTNVICSKHFRQEDFVYINGKLDLKDDAVPRLFLPKNVVLTQIVNPSDDIPTKKMRIETLQEPSSSGNKENLPGPSSLEFSIRGASKESNILQKPEQTSLDCFKTGKDKEQLSSSDSIGARGSPKRKRRIVKMFHTYATTPAKIRVQLKREKEKTKILSDKLKIVQQRNKRLKLKVSHLQDVVGNLKRKELLSTDACTTLEKTFSDVPLVLMKRIMVNSKIGGVSRQKYDATLRSFAVTLQFYSSSLCLNFAVCTSVCKKVPYLYLF